MNFDDKSIADIYKMILVIEDDPANKNTEKGSIFIYTKKAMKRLDKLRWEITYKLIDKKKENGTFVETGGYSGRKCNKRR
jgi:hypothetical protein